MRLEKNAVFSALCRHVIFEQVKWDFSPLRIPSPPGPDASWSGPGDVPYSQASAVRARRASTFRGHLDASATHASAYPFGSETLPDREEAPPYFAAKAAIT
jgi:hypothetical protein